MENNKTVACIIPCFRYGKYLEECVDTVVNQTYKASEIIIVNDGSDDNTSEVANMLIKKYPDEPIRLVEKENGGLSSARNAGIAVSKSEYCFALDADDKLVPGAIEEHVKLMEDDMTIAQTALMEFDERYTIAIPAESTSLCRILQSNTIFCNAMFSKRVWTAVGGYDESEILRWGREDHEFWVRCLEYGCTVRTSDFIALRYRCHEGQMTQATLHPHWGEIELYFREKHKHLFEKCGLDINKLQ